MQRWAHNANWVRVTYKWLKRSPFSKAMDFKDCLGLVLLGSHSHCMGITLQQRKREHSDRETEPVDCSRTSGSSCSRLSDFQVVRNKFPFLFKWVVFLTLATKSILTRRPAVCFWGKEGQENWGHLQGSVYKRTSTGSEAGQWWQVVRPYG